MLGREAVVHGNKAASGRLCQRCRDAVMGLDTAGDHAAAMEEDKARQWVGRGIGRRIEAVRNAARRARQDAVNPADGRHVRACELHQLGERLAAVVWAWPQSIARRGRRRHGEKAFCQGIEGHIGSGIGR